MANALRMDVRKRSEELIDVQLDLDHGHDGLQFIEEARGPIHGLGYVLEDKVQVDFVLLQVAVSKQSLPKLPNDFYEGR